MSTHSATGLRSFILAFAFLALIAISAPAFAQPTLSKVFTPSTIGPGSVSTITFTITNGSISPVTDLAFTDVLPVAVTIADPAAASTTCSFGVGGSLDAPDGGTTITLTGGQVPGSSSCTVTVDVTSSTVGVHTNPAITLSSSAGSSMSLPADLTVATNRPGFSKSFAPSSVPLGGRSTLTFTIDNSANASLVTSMVFTDNLPAGLVIADPSNASNSCSTGLFTGGILTATPGTGVIDLGFGGGLNVAAVAALSTCEIIVDVVATGGGDLDNITGELTSASGSSGKASDTLLVTVTPLALTKSFTDDPVPPGGAATLEFTIDNFDRDFSADGIAFTDDLTTLVPPLAGLTFDSLLSNDCGGLVAGVGGTTISFTGGSLPAEGSCTIRVSLSVPAGATPGTYTNTTSAVTGTVDGSPVVGNMASDDLFVEPVPLLTKEFLEDGTMLPDPIVNAGDDVILQFTVTNTSTTSMATDITFLDELTDFGPGTGFLPFPVSVTLPPVPDPPCGAGSSLALVFVDTDRQGLLLTGGNLAAAPGAGSSCTFYVTLSLPADLAPAIYVNTTEEITATVDGATRTGDPASDTLTVIGAPELNKEFIDDPVAPGGTVTLEFILTYSANAPGDATGITFTDDLAPVLAGLTANLPPIPDPPCGVGSSLMLSAGDTLLTLLGGTLMPGEVCAFTVTLDVPAGAAPGTYTNTTSGVSATVQGQAATSLPDSDDLSISGLSFSKEFINDPVIAGDTTTLRFTIDNIHPTDDATSILFTDSLPSVLPGLAAILPPTVNTCGGTMSGPSLLIYVGGSLTAGSTCTIELDVLVPLGTADDTYSNLSGSLTATQSGGVVVIDPAFDLLIVDSNLLQLTKAFTDDPVAPGDPVTLEFTLSNLDAGQAASMIDFSDDLGATLTGLTFDSVLLDTCGGLVAGTGTDMITVTGASVAAGGSCTLRVSLSVPGGATAGIYPNTSSSLTGMIGGFPVTGDPANDDLEITQLLLFSKSFDGPTTATGTATLTFTITNPGVDTASDISFSDDLNAVIPGLIATTLPAVPCGAGSSITGIGFLTFIGGELPPANGMCSFDVEVLVPATATAGTFPNTTSDLTSAGLLVADPATADLVIEPPPTFAKAFAPAFLGLGQSSTLTFTIDNSGSVLAASSLAFTDNLPAGIVVATPSVTSNTCGGTLTAIAGAGTISLSGGAVGAGLTCTIDVAVTGVLVGVHVNVTGDLMSTSGNSGTATDTLTVNPQPGFAKAFAPNPILIGGTSTLTFTIDNTGSTVDAIALAFTDNLPTEITVATPANVVNTCGGTVTAASGTSVIDLTGGAVSAASSCTLSVDVTSSTAGSHVNLTGDLTSSLGNSGTATDTLTVDPPPGFAKVFAPDIIPEGGVSTLTFTIDNTASTTDATGLDFTDNLPALVVVATPANVVNTCGGTVTAISGTGVISLTGGTASAASTCTLSVDVTSDTTGDYVNLTGDLTSSLGNSGTATDSLRVNPAKGFSKSFAPDPIAVDGVSTLTFLIDNTGSTVDATGLDFTDNLPASVTVASPANVVNTCVGGTVTATPGSSVIAYTGGTVPAASTCTLSVDVTSDTAGTHVNVSGDLTSSNGNSGTATDTLTVNPVPGFAKSFSPDTIPEGGVSTLTFTIDNTASTADATGLDFTDNLPAPVVVATPANVVNTCGGTVTATSGTGVISLTGGTASAASTCTLSVDVTSDTAGIYVNVTGDLTSSLGNSGTATDTLTVNPPKAFTKNFDPNPIAVDGVSTLTFTIDNSGSTVDATGLDFTDNLPASVTVASPANVVNTCVGGTVTATPGTGVISYTGGTVPAASTCTLSVDTTSDTAGMHVNVTGDLTSSNGNSGSATDTLVVDPPPGFVKVFDPDIIPEGAVSTLTFTIDNTASTADATGLDFTDNLPALVLVATPSNVVNTCGGAVTATAGTSVISLTGGTVAAASTCTLSVDVTSDTAGTYVNVSGDLTSSLGNSGTATDTLRVNPAKAFSKTFDPDIIPEGTVSTLTFTIDNTGSTVDATDLDFTDNLPVPVVVATPANVVNTCIGGTVTATPGTGVIAYTGGTVPAASICTLSVDVTSDTAGIYVNVTGDLTSSNGNSGTATDTLTVNPPKAFSKSFDPDPIVAGGVSTLTFTIDNTGSTVDATDLDFTDNLPASVTVASPANVVNNCIGGTVTATPGTGVIAYTGGTVPAASICTLSVDVIGGTAGMHVNVTGDLTSSNGNSGTATDTLEVVAGVLDISKAFVVLPTPPLAGGAPPVLPGGMIVVEYTVTNLTPIFTAVDVAFSDDLDAALPGLTALGLPVADVCGAGSQIDGTSVVTLTGGVLPPESSCIISVVLQVPADAAFGTIASTTGAVTGDLAGVPVTGNSASADLEVVFIDFVKEFDSTGSAGGLVSLTFTLVNPDPANGIDNLTFDDDLDAVLPGLEAIGLPQSDVCGTGSQIEGTSLLLFTGGSLGPGESCSFTVDLMIPMTATSGDYDNVTSVLEGSVNSLPVEGDPAGAAMDSLEVVGSVIEIPTLTGWGFIALSGLLALLGVRRMRRPRDGGGALSRCGRGSG